MLNLIAFFTDALIMLITTLFSSRLDGSSWLNVDVSAPSERALLQPSFGTGTAAWNVFKTVPKARLVPGQVPCIKTSIPFPLICSSVHLLLSSLCYSLFPSLFLGLHLSHFSLHLSLIYLILCLSATLSLCNTLAI